MITRVFRGRIRPGSRDDFVRHLSDVGIPEFLRSPGVTGLEVHLPENDGDEILCATLWRDMAHVKTFAGDGWADPKMHGDEDSMLLAASVSHYIGHRRSSGPLVSPLPRSLPDDTTRGRVRLQDRQGSVIVDGERFDLPPRELRLFKVLLSGLGDPLAPRDLALQVWPEGACMTPDDVRRAIHKLRRALGDHQRRRPLIRNRRGFGYLVEL